MNEKSAIFQPIRSKRQIECDELGAFSRAKGGLDLSALNYDWFI